MLAAGLARRSFALTKYSFEDEDYDKSRWQVSQQRHLIRTEIPGDPRDQRRGTCQCAARRGGQGEHGALLGRARMVSGPPCAVHLAGPTPQVHARDVQVVRSALQEGRWRPLSDPI